MTPTDPGAHPGAPPPDPAPNPGSRAAYALGCTCAELDNNHGQYPPRPPDGWWVTLDCPVHMPRLIPNNTQTKEPTMPE